MITLLTGILKIFEEIPQYILYAIQSFCNLLFEGVQAVFETATSLIPLPSEPGAPPLIHEINWFFPVGPVITIMVPIVSGYVIFMAIRWILKWSGNL